MAAVPILFMEVATEFPLAKACEAIPARRYDLERLWRDCALGCNQWIRGLSARELATIREDRHGLRAEFSHEE
jgi:hypothetical protein